MLRMEDLCQSFICSKIVTAGAVNLFVTDVFPQTLHNLYMGELFTSSKFLSWPEDSEKRIRHYNFNISMQLILCLEELHKPIGRLCFTLRGRGLLQNGFCLDIDSLENTGCPAKLFPLGYLLFCRLLLTQIAKVGTFSKNSGDLLHDRHKNFENRFRNS